MPFRLAENTGCLKNGCTRVLQMLLYGECYENVYTLFLTPY
jgi:hypothetical protein